VTDEGALAALTVLDLSEGIAGPYAARLFAEQGARVIKVERPGRGDIARGWPRERPGLVFAALNAGKLSLTLDYETPEGAAVLRRLAEDADAIIEDHPTQRRDDLGLGDAELIARAPRLVIAQVSGFGSTGPNSGRPLTTLTLAAAAGLLSPEQLDEPFHRPLEQVVGVHAYLATLAALWHAAQTEHGQVVEVSGIEALVATAGKPLADRLSGPDSVRAGSLAEGFGASVDLAALRADSLLQQVDAAAFGLLAYPAAPFALAAAPALAAGRAPALGEHNERLLSEIGFDAGEIEALRARGVV